MPSVDAIVVSAIRRDRGIETISKFTSDVIIGWFFFKSFARANVIRDADQVRIHDDAQQDLPWKQLPFAVGIAAPAPVPEMEDLGSACEAH